MLKKIVQKSLYSAALLRTWLNQAAEPMTVAPDKLFEGIQLLLPLLDLLPPIHLDQAECSRVNAMLYEEARLAGSCVGDALRSDPQDYADLDIDEAELTQMQKRANLLYALAYFLGDLAQRATLHANLCQAYHNRSAVTAVHQVQRDPPYSKDPVQNDRLIRRRISFAYSVWLLSQRTRRHKAETR